MFRSVNIDIFIIEIPQSKKKVNIYLCISKQTHCRKFCVFRFLNKLQKGSILKFCLK